MRIYVTYEGDTLYKIADRNQIDIAELLSLNPHIADPNRNFFCLCLKSEAFRFGG